MWLFFIYHGVEIHMIIFPTEIVVESKGGHSESESFVAARKWFRFPQTLLSVRVALRQSMIRICSKILIDSGFGLYFSVKNSDWRGSEPQTDTPNYQIYIYREGKTYQECLVPEVAKLAHAFSIMDGIGYPQTALIKYFIQFHALCQVMKQMKLQFKTGQHIQQYSRSNAGFLPKYQE